MSGEDRPAAPLGGQGPPAWLSGSIPGSCNKVPYTGGIKHLFPAASVIPWPCPPLCLCLLFL